jgi:hypothetical protein
LKQIKTRTPLAVPVPVENLKKKEMKKLLCICLVLTSVNCFSQGLLKRLQFGLKAGANYSNYSNADFETEALLGFHAGAIVGFKISDRLSIQQEFLFSSQGAKVKNNLFGEENVKVSYITVPFLVKYRTPLGIYIEAGPQVGIRAKEDLKDTRIGEFKKMDLSAAGGIGFQTKGGFGIGARYVAGLSKVGDFDISNVKTDFKTNIIQASIFYIF